MSLLIWSIITLIVFYYLLKERYLSSIFILLSTTLLFEILPNIYIWDFYFLSFLFLVVIKSKVRLSISQLYLFIIFVIFLFFNAFLSGEFYSLIEVFRLIQLYVFCMCLYFYYSKNIIEKDFINIVFICVLLNITLHFFQIFDINIGYSLKPTGSRTIGGFFNDSSELGPFFIFSAFIFYFNFLQTNKHHLYGLSILIAVFGVVISFNRTSFILLPFLLLFVFISSKISIKLYLIFSIVMLLPFGLNFSEKNFTLFYTIVNNPEQLYSGTLELRVMNWARIFNHYVDNCNYLFGCQPGFFDVNRDSFLTGYGVFSVDNAFLRILVSYGLIGSFLLVLFLTYLFYKANHILLWIIILGFGMMIELYKSLPVILILICCFSLQLFKIPKR